MPYSPLNGALQEIRLLSFTSFEPTAGVSVRLDSVSLLASPGYQTLSYVWGMETKGRRINVQCGSGPSWELGVHDNVYDALLRLRERSIQYIWIDAICINQNDKLEKAQQIRMMKEIYSKGQSVNIWLGESTHSCCPALRVRFSEWTPSTKYPTRPVKWNEACHWVRENWEALHSTLSNTHDRWTERLWIVEEAALSSQRFLWFGSRRMEVDSLLVEAIRDVVLRELAADSMTPGQILTPNAFDCIINDVRNFIRNFRDFLLRDPYLEERPANLVYLSMILRRQTAYKPHDKVYALLAMVSYISFSACLQVCSLKRALTTGSAKAASVHKS